MRTAPTTPSKSRGTRIALTSSLLVMSAWIGGARDLAHAHLALIRQGPESAGIARAGEEFGRALAVGDFNGDGVEDLATGAPFEANDVGGNAAHGAVVVSYGSAVGLIPEGAQLLSVGDLADLSVRYGEALAAGDFNGDGFSDLAVGLPHRDVGGHPSAGEVWVHYGSATGLNPVPGIVLSEPLAGGAAENEDRFGQALATADFDLDDRDDLAIGAPGEDAGAGAVFHFAGSATGITLTGAGWFKQSSLGQLNTAGDAMGQALAAGRFDNDAYADLAVGTPAKDVGGFTDCGRVYFLRGSPSGLVSAGSASVDPVSLGNDPQSDGRFGSSLAAGRFFDTNGPLDLAVGEPEADLGGQADAGRVVVLDLDAIPAPAFVPQSVQTKNQFIGIPGQGAELADRFGASLAAGRFDLDAYDELAVAVPYENVDLGDAGAFIDAGIVHLFYGSTAGLVAGTYNTFDAQSQNDLTASGELFGWALAFGRFDASAHDNLAVGTIGKDYISHVAGVPTLQEAGLVYVVAPWRQIDHLPHRSSVALDCDADIIYSQRMFDRMRPASTTKTMTLLLACEAVQSDEVEPDYLYTVPSWVAQDVYGSQMGLVTGEKITLENLMKGLMPPSGNDASFAIADILEGDGNPWGGSIEGTLPAFQARMNARAADFGMTRTTLTNPAGLDAANHFTTTRDFAALSYHAMQNSCVRQIVGAPGWLVDHLLPVSTMDGWLSLGGPSPTPGYTPVTEYFSAGYMSNIRSVIPSATGIKGGYTGGGRVTGLWSAQAAQGEVFAAAFGMRSAEDGDVVTDCLACTGGGLLQLGRSICLESDFAPPPPPPPPGPFGMLTGIPACPDSLRRLTVHSEAFPAGDALIELYRPTHSATSVGTRVAIVRSSRLTLSPNEVVDFGIGAVTAHQGARIVHLGTGIAQVLVTQTLPTGTTLNATLPPNGSLVTPAHPAAGSNHVMSVRNVGAATITVAVEELGYQVERRLAAAALGSPSFSATLQRNGHFADEMMGVYVLGTDAGCEDELDLVLRPPGATVGVPGDDIAPSNEGMLTLGPARPNPSRGPSTLRFELARAASVDATVFDAQGRRVRTLARLEPLAAGAHQLTWDGHDDAGARVGAGVFFVRLQAGGRAESRSVIRLE